MRPIIPFRLPALVFGTAVAAALTFGAGSAVAAPQEQTADRFFCGFTIDDGSCAACCGGYQASWEGAACWCELEGRS